MADIFTKPIPDIWRPSEGDFAKWLYDLWAYLDAHPIPSGDELGAMIEDYLDDHPIEGAVTSVNGHTGEVTITLASLGGVTQQQAAAAAPVQSVNGQKGAVTITLASLGGVTQQQAAAAAPVQSVNGRTGAVGNLVELPSGYVLSSGGSVSVPIGFSSITIDPLFEGTLPAGNKGYRIISVTPDNAILMALVTSLSANYPVNVARQTNKLSIEYGPIAESIPAQGAVLFVYCSAAVTLSME